MMPKMSLAADNPESAESSKPSRAALLGLARQFVDRIGSGLETAEKRMETPPVSTAGVGKKKDVGIDSIPDGEMMLLQVRIGNLDLNQTIVAIKDGDDVQVSLQDFVNAARFAITLDPKAGKADGWYIRENQPFHLDLNAGTVQAGERSFPMSAESAFADGDDIMVRGQNLARWFDFTLEMNYSFQYMNVATAQKWPIQEAIERAQKKEKGTGARTKPPEFPRKVDDYKMVSIPNADINVRHDRTRSKIDGNDSNSSYNARLSGDLAGHTAKVNFSGNQENKIASVFTNFSRESESADLLGPLAARKYEFGDVVSVSVPHTGSSPTETGARVTNRDPNRTTSTVTQIDGDGPIGWDVELFRNEQFVGITTVDQNGRFSFEDVFLFGGDNRFRIVKYGPQGEIQEEEQIVSVTPDVYGQDGGIYDVSATMQNWQTWEAERSRDKDRGTPHLAATYERQLASNLSAHVGVRTRQEHEVQKAYFNAGAVTSIKGAIVNGDVAVDADGFYKGIVSARRRVGEQNFAGIVSYESEGFEPGSPILNSPSALSLSLYSGGPVPGFSLSEFSYNWDSAYTFRGDDSRQYGTTLGTTGRVGGLTLSHDISRSVQEFANGDSAEDISGSFSVRGRALKTTWRTGFSYDVKPDAGIEEYFLRLNRNLSSKLSSAFDLRHKTENRYTIGDLSFSWDGDYFNLSPGMSYDSDRTMHAYVNMNFGLTRDPRDGGIIMTGSKVAARGGASVNVFLDKDGDGVFSEGDEYIEDAIVEAIHARREAVTDAEGNAFLFDLPEGKITDIAIRDGTMPDPTWLPATPGVSVRPRAGHIAEMEFPVTMTGEMDGIVYAPTPDGRGRPVGGIGLALYDAAGKKVRETLSANDGFYVLDRIPPGRYVLMTDAESAKMQRLFPSMPQTIDIGYDGPLIYGNAIMLQSHENGGVAVSMAADFPDYAALYPGLDLSALANGGVALNLGDYNSGLMASVVWYRMKTRYGHILGDAELIAPLSRMAMMTGQGVQTLRAMLPVGTGVDDAHTRCRLLQIRGLHCAIEIVPAVAQQVSLR